MRGAALAALDRPAMALGPKERAEVELGAAFFARLAELVSAILMRSGAHLCPSAAQGRAWSAPAQCLVGSGSLLSKTCTHCIAPRAMSMHGHVSLSHRLRMLAQTV